MTDHSEFLVETEWLHQHLADPRVRVVDIRGSVPPVPQEIEPVADGALAGGGLGYQGAFDEYSAGHIPGAVYVDWTTDIVDLEDGIPVQVAKEDRFAAAMRRAGIGDEHLVVVYDTHPAATFATRLWWALRYYGHTEVVVLNGGLAKWEREGRPVEAGAVTNQPAVFTPKVQPRLRATVTEVVAAMQDGTATLVDARDAGQYTGAVVRPGNRRGHIPGAISIPREDLVNLSAGTWRSPAEIAGILAGAGLSPDDSVIAYCNGGVASTAVQFGMALAGYPAVATYDGSWNEWSAREDLPVEAS